MASPAQTLLIPFGWEGRFEMLERIGSGAMGHVWRAVDVADGRVVALKLLDPSRCGDEHTLARLEIEGETLMRLRKEGEHEHVVPMVDFKITEANACLVMEFIPGLNLKKWCSTHGLSLQDRVRLIAQVARAAGWFHELGVVHRDLKPANILVSAVTHQPVIVDFSIAKVEDTLTLTLTNEALGTAPYMAPEQLDRRRGAISPATDVYALGATLYELLTEVHPHPGELMVVVQRHTEEARPARPSALNSAISRDLECILLKSLSPRPQDRYASGLALAEDLERFLAGRPVVARPISRVTHLLRQARRRPALTAALAACGVLVLAVFWNVRHQAAERHRFTLQQEITMAMQAPVWTEDAQARVGQMLSALAQVDPKAAADLQDRLHRSVVENADAILRRAHLHEADAAGVRQDIAWLRKQPSAKHEVARLEGLLNERVSKWETVAALRPPLTDLQGLFPEGGYQVRNGMLFPGVGADTPVVVAERVTLPLEVNTTLQVHPAAFRRLALGLTLERSVTEAVLCLRSEATPAMLALLEEPVPGPHACLLLVRRNGVPQKVAVIADEMLTHHPMRLELKVEPQRMEVIVNDQWRLVMHADYVLGSMSASNKLHFSSPTETSLQELVVRVLPKDSASPLERADLLSLRGKWAGARSLYEEVRGDPSLAVEADYKIAHCLRRLGDVRSAKAMWARLADGPASSWRDRAAYQLWAHTAQQDGVQAAARLLARAPKGLSQVELKEFGRGGVEKLTDLYFRPGLAIGLLNVDPEQVSAGALAYQVLRRPPVEIANRFAMAHHMARLGEVVNSMHERALQDPLGSAADPATLRAATNCLDQWCRLEQPEKKPALARALQQWQAALPADPTVACIAAMERARQAARSQRWEEAIHHAQEARRHLKADDRRLAGAALLEGMLHRIAGDEARAQRVWAEALQTADDVVTKSPLFLCDYIVLRSLVQKWSPSSVSDIIGTLVTMHLPRGDSVAAKGRFVSVFCSDATFVTTLNHLFQDEAGRGRHLAEDHVLYRGSPRLLIGRYHRLLFESYFRTAFPGPVLDKADEARLKTTVEQLITEMTVNRRVDSGDWFGYIRAWGDRASVQEVLDGRYPCPAELVANLKWLLQTRHALPRHSEQ